MAQGQSTTVKLAGALLVACAALVAGMVSGAPVGEEGPAPTRDEQAGPIIGTVEQVTDGDTLRVRRADGRSERVRLIGIDAPELSTTRTGFAQCGGLEARNELDRWAPPGTRVRLATDRTQDARDRFGRLLGYVSPDAGSEPGGADMVELQQRLLEAGWARVYVYAGSPFEQVRDYRAYAAEARRARRGVWAWCGGRFDRPAP